MKDKTRNNGKDDGSFLPQSAENAPESRGQGTGALSRKILIGLALGIGVGLFFGESAGKAKIFGDAFIALLKMTVLPYIVVSLVANIGRLSLEKGKRLVFVAAGVLAVLLGLGIVVVLGVPLFFPQWTSASFFSTTMVTTPPQPDFIKLYLPANPFESLAENIVPAVVVFCIFLGTALVGLPGAKPLLDALDVLAVAINTINKMVVKLTPYGVFAIAASTAGTMTLEEVGRLQAYLLTYTFLVVLLSFLVLPALIAATTPFRYRDVLSTFRATLLTIFATGKIIVVLPQLIDNVKRLYADAGVEDTEVDSAADILMPLAYPFPNLGTLVIMMFVPFSAWYLGLNLLPSQVAVFLGAGLISSFVAPVVGIPFLLDLVHIPADMFELFVVSTVYTDRIRVVLGAMHLVALTVIASAILTGRFKMKVPALLRLAGVTVMVGVAGVFGIRGWLAHSLSGAYTGDQTFVQMALLKEPVPTRLYRNEQPAAPAHDPGVSRLREIRDRGFLRVGYLADHLPFAFVNESGRLVGFDVEMANELARDLGVRLEFVRLSPGDMTESMNTGRCDLLMTGLMVTPERAMQMALTRPYLELTPAFIVSDSRRGTFSSLEKVRELEGLRLGVVSSLGSLTRKVEQALPDATVVPLESPRPFFRGREKNVDALLFSAEAGSAWTLLYPAYSVAIPRPVVGRVPLAYAVAQRDLQLKDFLDQWLELKKSEGVVDRFYRHWILGEGAQNTQPRWSILGDVLHRKDP